MKKLNALATTTATENAKWYQNVAYIHCEEIATKKNLKNPYTYTHPYALNCACTCMNEFNINEAISSEEKLIKHHIETRVSLCVFVISLKADMQKNALMKVETESEKKSSLRLQWLTNT